MQEIKKLHYKMYKNGKNWVMAAISAVTFGIGLGLTQLTTVQAATTAQPQISKETTTTVETSSAPKASSTTTTVKATPVSTAKTATTPVSSSKTAKSTAATSASAATATKSVKVGSTAPAKSTQTTASNVVSTTSKSVVATTTSKATSTVVTNAKSTTATVANTAKSTATTVKSSTAAPVKVTVPATSKVKAVTTTPTTNVREQGTDWAVYQGNTGKKGYSTDKFAIAQIGGIVDGVIYNQSTYQSQVKAGKAQGLRMHTYIWDQFGSSTNDANRVVNYFLPKVTAPKGSIVALDFEAGASKDVNLNTNTLISQMHTIKNAGFTPMYYSYKPYTLANVNTTAILNAFPNSLWMAAYADNSVTTKPNYQYFPSMNGVAIWQFTSNYVSGGLDGDVDLTGITKNGYVTTTAKPATPTSTVNLNFTEAAPSKTTKPVVKSTIPAGFIKEAGQFTNGDVPISMHASTTTTSKIVAVLKAKQSVIYDSYADQNGYVWVHYKNGSTDVFVPTHPTGTANNVWGKFSAVPAKKTTVKSTAKPKKVTVKKPVKKVTVKKTAVKKTVAKKTTKPKKVVVKKPTKKVTVKKVTKKPVVKKLATKKVVKKVTLKPTKKATVKVPKGFTKESATFVNGDGMIKIHATPSASSKVIAQLKAGTKVKYDSYVNRNGYIWVHYKIAGKDAYLPTHPTGTANDVWGKFI